jgi:hypothetical protein
MQRAPQHAPLRRGVCAVTAHDRARSAALQLSPQLAPPARAQRRRQRRAPLVLARSSRSDDDSSPDAAAASAPPPPASFSSTPSAVKGLVSALTAAINALSGAVEAPRAGEDDDEAQRAQPPLTPEALLAGVRGDFTERGYLWTGDISAELYDRDCTFTDPTLSFRRASLARRACVAFQ